MDIREAFEIAMQGEIEGRELYKAAARQTEDKKAKDAFMKLANDEDMHLAFLKNLYKDYTEGKEVELPELPKVTEFEDAESPIFTREFKNFVKDRDFEVATLSIAMKLELESSRFYKEMADKVEDKKLKDFFLYLSKWEESHFDALKKQKSFFEEYYKTRYSFYRGF